MPNEGMTLKQMNRRAFYVALENYRKALQLGVTTPKGRRAIIAASLDVHAAKGGVAKRYWPMVNRVLREHKALLVAKPLTLI